MHEIIYPTNDEIISIVIDYIKNSIYKYAILIDGEWGSGKTWFIKNMLMPEINKYIKNIIKNDLQYKKTVYLSLNGLESINEISAKLFFSIIPEDKRTITKNLSSILNTFLKGRNVNINVNDIGNLLSSFVNISEYIIIFDDLERCKCDIAETLGFINGFVEHNNTKIILVANESEIEVSDSYTEPLKYIAATQKSIAIEKQTGGSFTIEQIKERIDKMFKEESKYDRIKEKLIGQTIKYRPDLNKIIPALIKDNIDEKNFLYRLLLQEQGNFIKLMQNDCSYNFRTFQFFLSIIIKLDKLIRKVNYEKKDEYEKIIRIVIKYCFHISFKYKRGEYTVPWEKDELYGHISLTDAPYMSETIIGFAFVDYAISYNVYDEKFITTSIKSFIDYIKEQDEESQTRYSNDPDVIILSTWWEFSDEKILATLHSVCKKVKNNEFIPKHYINLIKLTLPPLIECSLNRSDFDDMYRYMKSKIQNEEINYSRSDFIYFNQSKKVAEECKKKFTEIKEIVNAKKKENDFDMVAGFLQRETWGELLYDDLCERARNQSIITEEKSLISKMDIGKICELIEKSSSKQISAFRYYIAELYNFVNISDYYMNDIPNLKELLSTMEGIDKTGFDNIKLMNIELLEKLLKEKIELLK